MAKSRVLALVASLLPACSAAGHDWYSINNHLEQCVDQTEFAIGQGVPQLASPANVKAFYESQGDEVTPLETKDAPDRIIIGLIVKDPRASTSVYSFYSSMALCESALAYDRSKGFRPDPSDLR